MKQLEYIKQWQSCCVANIDWLEQKISKERNDQLRNFYVDQWKWWQKELERVEEVLDEQTKQRAARQTIAKCKKG